MVLVFIFFTQFNNVGKNKLGLFGTVKPSRQSVNLSPKLEKIQRVDSTKNEEVGVPVTPGVFNSEYLSGNSKVLGSQTSTQQPGAKCYDDAEVVLINNNSCKGHGDILKIINK